MSARGDEDTLPSAVYERLREDIISGKLADGKRLIGTRLAAELKVSRTPVREALKMLAYEGLVENVADGVRVVTRSTEQLFDLYEIRIPLETVAAGAAAARSKDYEIIQIQRLCDAMTTLPSDDIKAVVEANRKFHQCIWKASRNAPLIDMLKRLDMYLARYPHTAFDAPDRLAESVAEHQAIVDAIRLHDETKARTLTQEHFTSAREIRLERFSGPDA